MERKMSISLKTSAGTISKFIAYVGENMVISGDGTQERVWEGNVGNQVKMKVTVSGIGTARYEFSINLPNTLNSQKMEFSLRGGFHEFEFTTY